jgi:hypothetical protein
MGSDAMVHGSISELSTMPAMGQLQKLRLAGNDALHRRVPDYLWQQ